MEASVLDDWPSHGQELTRKTADQIQIWGERHDRGLIDARTWLCIISALYDTTSGLIDKDVSDLLADLHREALSQATKKIV